MVDGNVFQGQWSGRAGKGLCECTGRRVHREERISAGPTPYLHPQQGPPPPTRRPEVLTRLRGGDVGEPTLAPASRAAPRRRCWDVIAGRIFAELPLLSPSSLPRLEVGEDENEPDDDVAAAAGAAGAATAVAMMPPSFNALPGRKGAADCCAAAAEPAGATNLGS